MVIAVNGWMNHPTGFRISDGQAIDVHPWSALFGNSYFWHELVHMYLAGYIVTGFARRRRLRVGHAARALGPLRAHRARDPARGRRARRAGRRSSSATGSPATSPQKQPVKLAAIEGLGQTTAGAPDAHPRLVRRHGRRVRDRDPATCSRSSRSTARTRRCRGSTRCPPADRPAGERRAVRLPDDGRHRHGARAARRVFALRADPPAAPAGVALVLSGASSRPGRCRSSR